MVTDITPDPQQAETSPPFTKNTQAPPGTAVRVLQGPFFTSPRQCELCALCVSARYNCEKLRRGSFSPICLLIVTSSVTRWVQTGAPTQSDALTWLPSHQCEQICPAVESQSGPGTGPSPDNPELNPD